MRNLLKVNMLAVASLAAVMSCTKEPEAPAGDQLQELHFIVKTAENAPVKSFIDNELDGTYTPKWSNGDKLALFVGDISSSTSDPTATLSNISDNGTTATFDGTVPTSLTEGSFLSFSPAGAFVKGYTDGTVGITLSEIQNPSNLTIDEACDVLVAKPCDYLAENGTVYINNLFFKRIFSVVKVNLKGVEALNGEKVTSFTFNAPVTLTGRAAVDLSTASISKWNVDNKSVTAKYSEDYPAFGGTDGWDNSVWLVVNSTTVASESTITFSGETENYTFSKEVTLTKDLVFPQSQIAVINLTIGDDNYTAKTAETRIFAEGFDNVSENKSTPQPSVSGAEGTGVTENLEYVYTSADVRTSSNGHSSSDYYLWNGTAAAIFNINNIAISDETSLLFSCQGRTSQGTSVVTVRFKESSSDVWNIAGTFTVGTDTFDSVQKVIFTVSSSATSLDIQITNDVGNLLLDDFVLESFVDNRTTLSAPANVSVSVDAETPNQLNISWDAVENANGYEVVLSADGQDDIVKTATESPLAVADLDYSTTYSVKVKATTTDVENFIESEYSTVVAGTTGAKPEGAAEWVSTSFANLKAGDKVVIVRTSGTTYAMTNNNGTTSAPSVSAVTISGDKLEKTPSDNIVWYVGVDGANKIFYTSSEQTSWLYCTSTNNGVRVGTNDSKTFTYASNYLQHVGTSRYIGVYNNEDWRCYTSCTGTSNIANQTFGFFVEQSGSSEGGSDPVQLDAPVVSCSAQTANSLTFTWAAVANATGYQVSTDGGVNYGATQTKTTYTWSGLSAESSYTLYVKAVSDNTSYTDSNAASATGTTTASSGEGGETPAVGTVLWSDSFGDWGGSSTTFSNLTSTISTYTYTGRSGYLNNTNVILTSSSDNVKGATSTGANMTSGHLWFNKSTEASVTTSDILLYGATKITLSFAQGGSGSSITSSYSTDGGSTWTELGSTSGPNANYSYTISVNSGVTSISLRFTHLSTNEKNTRVDDFSLIVAE